MEATATVAMEEDESEEDPGLRKTRLAAQKEEEEEEEEEERRRAEEDEDDPGVFEEVCPTLCLPCHCHRHSARDRAVNLSLHGSCTTHRRTGSDGRKTVSR